MIHILRNRALGDVLWVEPIIRYFLEMQKSVNLKTLYPEIFENYPLKGLSINQSIFESSSKEKKFQRFIDLNMSYESRPKMHILQAYMQEALIDDMPLSYPKIYLSEQELMPVIEGDYAILHIDSKPQNYRNVYDVSWDRIVQHLESAGLNVIQISPPSHKLFTTQYEPKSLRNLFTLIAKSRLFIGPDSGPSHIAASFQIPSIIFFGSVNPKYRHLASFKGTFLQGQCSHSFCYHEAISTEGVPCKLQKIQPPCASHSNERVIQAISNLLNHI
jgi:ADP-heptose:LPS heptosyltransferase